MKNPATVAGRGSLVFWSLVDPKELDQSAKWPTFPAPAPITTTVLEAMVTRLATKEFIGIGWLVCPDFSDVQTKD